MLIVRPFSRSPKKGAETLVWLAASPEAGEETGGYFYDKRRARPTRIAQDMDVAAALWEVSEEQVRTGQDGDRPA